jgi:hypothetical protein
MGKAKILTYVPSQKICSWTRLKSFKNICTLFLWSFLNAYEFWNKKYYTFCLNIFQLFA